MLPHSNVAVELSRTFEQEARVRLGAADELEPEQGGSKSATVLLVEDDPLIRMILADFFRDEALLVVEALSADEAWGYLATGGKADLVLTDIHMQGRIDGRQLATLIRQQFPHIIVIVASGNPGPSLGVEFTNFLQKPFELDQAIRLIRDLLGRDPHEYPDDPAGAD